MPATGILSFVTAFRRRRWLVPAVGTVLALGCELEPDQPGYGVGGTGPAAGVGGDSGATAGATADGGTAGTATGGTSGGGVGGSFAGTPSTGGAGLGGAG